MIVCLHLDLQLPEMLSLGLDTYLVRYDDYNCRIAAPAAQNALCPRQGLPIE